MAKPLRGECEVDLGGEKFTLRLALGQIEELEARLDVGLVELCRRFTTNQAKVSEAREVIAQGFAGAGIKKSNQQIAVLVEKAGIGVMETAMKMLLTIFGTNEGNAGAAGEANLP